MGVKLIAGLGNPGARYRGTRHNLGFRVVNRIARNAGLTWSVTSRLHGEVATLRSDSGGRVVLLKPLTFMNRSGQAVGATLRFHDVALEDLLVVVDDSELPLGRMRFRPRGSSGGHRGLEDVERALGSRDYSRLRLGIGPSRGDQTSFVLGRFTRMEEEIVEERLPDFAKAVQYWVHNDTRAAMNRYNASPEAAPGASDSKGQDAPGEPAGPDEGPRT
jgi:PTH1 family peptidyl-tRNA hydrolase